MNRKVKIIGLATLLLITLFASDTLASTVEMWFSNSPVDVVANRTATVDPGRSLWIVVRDHGRNIDPTVPDRIAATEIMVGSLISRLWLNPDWLEELKDTARLDSQRRYLMETGPNTGIFVFSEPIIIGARQLTTGGAVPPHTHIPAPCLAPGHQMWITEDGPAAEAEEVLNWQQIVAGQLGQDRMHFQLGVDGRVVANRSHPAGTAITTLRYLGRFIDGDTLIGIYHSALNDVVSASATVEIVRTKATIEWCRAYYSIMHGPATITIRDASENLDPGVREVVPVFIIVNPGTWNPVVIADGVQTAAARMRSATSFQMLLESGGVYNDTGNNWTCRGEPIRWYNIFSPDRHIVYPVTHGPGTANDGRGVYFATLPYLVVGTTTARAGLTKVVFLAKETGIDTGIFELDLDNIQYELGFTHLGAEYVLAAFYLDPNDFSDMAIATAYARNAPEHGSPVIFFADADGVRLPRNAKLSLGRDRINVGVDYSPLNLSHHHRDRIVVQVFTPQSTDRDWITLYEAGVNVSHFRSPRGLLGLDPVIWDKDLVSDQYGPWGTDAFDCTVRDLGLNKRLATFNRSAIFVRMNAVEVASYPNEPEIITAWHDPHARRVAFAEIEVTRTPLTMSFVDYAGVAVPGYTIGERVFIEVIDPDQNENPALRERIQGLVVFNLRTNKFVSRELREVDHDSDTFRTVDPIDLREDLDARTGDTIHAFFADPSDLSDAKIITTRIVAIVNLEPIAVDDFFYVLMDEVLFVPAPGVLYNDEDLDNDPLTAELVDDVDLPHTLVFETDGSFTFTPGPGFVGIVYFTYRARDDRGGISAIATVTITVKEEEVVLDVDDFVVVHALGSKFYFRGTGIADTFTVTIFNMLGRKVWHTVEHNVRSGEVVEWDGRCLADGRLLAKGPYIFVVVLEAQDGAILFTIRGTVFRK